MTFGVICGYVLSPITPFLTNASEIRTETKTETKIEMKTENEESVEEETSINTSKSEEESNTETETQQETSTEQNNDDTLRQEIEKAKQDYIDSLSQEEEVEKEIEENLIDRSGLNTEQQIEVEQELKEQWFTTVQEVPKEIAEEIIEQKIAAQEQFLKESETFEEENDKEEIVREPIATNEDTLDTLQQEREEQLLKEQIEKAKQDYINTFNKEKEVWLPNEEQIEQIIEKKTEDRVKNEIEKAKEAYLKSLDEEVYETTTIVRDLPKQEVIVYWCMNENACNYNSSANRSDRSCTYCGWWEICTREQTCCDDPDDNWQCWDQRIAWCTNRNACNYTPWADFDNGTCILPLWCDRKRCPWDYWAPLQNDSCGVCWWDGNSCRVVEPVVSTENLLKTDPVIEENRTVVEVIEAQPITETNNPVQPVQAQPVERTNPPIIQENTPKEIEEPQSVEEIQQPKSSEKQVITETEEPLFTAPEKQKKTDFSLTLWDDATNEFRRCLWSNTSHTVCTQKQLNGIEISNCMNTLIGYSLWERIVLTDIKKHTCTTTEQPEKKEVETPVKKKITQIVSPRSIEELSTKEVVIIPKNAPAQIEYKNDEVFVNANNLEELKETLLIIKQQNISILELSQPFLDTWIETIYKVHLRYEKWTITIEELLQTIYDLKIEIPTTSNNSSDENVQENKIAEETIMAVPIFKTASNNKSLSEKVYESLPYYMEKTWRQEFINQCWEPKKKIKIAVIDNAFDITHEDLQKNVVYSYDVADWDKDTSPPNDKTEWNHGNVASWIIGATADNNKWVIWVGNDSIELYLFKATSDFASWEDITAWIEALSEAIKHDVDIINVSRWAYIDHPVVKKVINKIEEKWIILIAAAWNYDNPEPFYPAAYSNVIGVWALNEKDQKASFSNFWSWVNKTIYWTDIASTDLNNKYDTYNWTSEASPLYAWILWLWMSYGFSPKEIAKIDWASWDWLLELAEQCKEWTALSHWNNGENNQKETHGSASDSIESLIWEWMISDVINDVFETNKQKNQYILLASVWLNGIFFVMMIWILFRRRKS